jgi:propanol-preferring alcohol dehydrogenase
MKAMVLERAGEPLLERELPDPLPGAGQIRMDVQACGVCRTDLHILDGELDHPKLPLVLGHQIVGTVTDLGDGVERFKVGDRVGVPWLGWTCGVCRYCRSGRENLCDQALFTGYQLDGGYAEATVADADFCFAIPAGYPDLQAAPLLCAGVIGYRTLRLEGRKVYAFTRPGDTAAQQLALELGAEWSGGSDEAPPVPLDAALLFAPAGELVPQALRAVGKGGTVVCGGIHMSPIPSFPYEILWGERTLRSVANLTRDDAQEFLALAPQVPIETRVDPFPLAEANEALAALRGSRVRGAAVLVVD